MESMEKVSAAYAEIWCIELEKGLRSKLPGRRVESINQIGPRLKRWSEESESQLTMPLYNMFGLVLGEDDLFAASIFIRLADAFVSGDKVTRTSVIKVFFPIRRHYKMKGAKAHGLFSNMIMENKLQVLKRVMGVLSAECVESRALTLTLLGCWAYIAEDVAEIRHEILSRLISFHALEVKAALFAAGCFSEVSNDFGYVFLENLLNIMTSSKTSLDIKIAAARALSKIKNPTLLAIESYKVELLCSFIAQNTSSHIQATALRCMQYVVERSACFLTISAFQALVRMFDDPNLPSPLRCDILRIFLKLIAYVLPGLSYIDLNELTRKLLRYVEDTVQSSFSERLLAFEVLVCVFSNPKERSEKVLSADSVTYLSSVVSTLSDQITQLVSLMLGDTENSETGLELGNILQLLLFLVENFSKMGCFILDKLHLVIENIVNSHSMPKVTAVHKVVDSVTKRKKISVRKFMVFIFRFLVKFVEKLDVACEASDQVVHKIKVIVFFVCGCSLFDCSIHTFYSLLLHSVVKWGCPLSENMDTDDSIHQKGKSQWKLLQCESLMYECAENMLAGGDAWCAYKAGNIALCEGVPHMANFIFQQLRKRVQSDFCCQWLNFLVQLTNAEKNILEGILMPYAAENAKSSEYIDKLLGACHDISASDKMLQTISIRTQTFCFQRMYLALRVKVLLACADILKLSDTYLSCKDDLETIKGMKVSLAGITSRLKRLTEECDLVASSFIDADPKSLKMIFALAFSCSFLAFSAEFATMIGGHFLFQNSIEHSSDFRYYLVQDLVGRLWHSDSKTCMDLISIFKEQKVHESSLHLQPRIQISEVGCISEEFLTVCKSSVNMMVKWLNDYPSVLNKDAALQVFKDGLQNLLNVLAAWTHMPHQFPKYFFRVRPTIGSLLIYSNADIEKQNNISVSVGSHLALNLCIRLKCVPSIICAKFSKIYCILYCKRSTLVAGPNIGLSGVMQAGHGTSKTDLMIELNKKLQFYILKQTREFIPCRDSHNVGEVEACVCFKTNGSMQGFSTCLLDVSTFPVGSYGVQWHCGGVDEQGVYWSILPLSPDLLFDVEQSHSER